jgi:hypothetical protein
MYIILKKTPQTSNAQIQDEILNVFYGNDETLIQHWVKQYIEHDIMSLKMKPLTQDIKTVSYEFIDDSEGYKLITRFKKINKGYIYNSSERSEEILYTIHILEYIDNVNQQQLQSSKLWQSINNEINNRVLKQLDKESLYQIFIKLQTKINSKTHWNSTEYINLLSEIIKSFKKELYSSITKKMSRFGKQINNPILIKTGSCKLEAKSKQE